jgi:hypothetical protein
MISFSLYERGKERYIIVYSHFTNVRSGVGLRYLAIHT